MWVPPPWLIHSALHGAAHAANSSRWATASVPGQATKMVRCEACGRNYGYALMRIGHGQADGHSADSYSLARQRAEAELQRLLASAVEAVPCPACGWYQSNMIPLARRRHRRWMVHVGQCLTVGLIPVAVLGELIYLSNDDIGNPPPVPWPAFVAGLFCLLAAGIGMLIWRQRLSNNFDPNEEDVGVRTLCGQSRATLLS
jgi:hypothetical protein